MKCFDLINRHNIWQALKQAGIKGKLYNAIFGMYRSVQACVRTDAGLTEYFSCPIGLKQSCMASPILFLVFIDELIKRIENSGIRGIQLFPDTTELLSLLFADDLALAADTVASLQKLLNLVKDFCDEKNVKVNAVKSKVMVFQNGGKLAKGKKWFFDNQILEVVSNFSYVGITLTQPLSLNRMASEQAYKAKRVLISILSQLYDYGQLSPKVFFNIFDTKISPILLYGSEIWGIHKFIQPEIVHNYACKRYLCVKK
jgi:hypothetical protein